MGGTDVTEDPKARKPRRKATYYVVEIATTKRADEDDVRTFEELALVEDTQAGIKWLRNPENAVCGPMAVVAMTAGPFLVQVEQVPKVTVAPA